MVNRYETYHNANISGLLPHTKGSYVHYDDYEALRQRVAELEDDYRAAKRGARGFENLYNNCQAKLAKAEEVLYTIMDYKPGSVDAGMSPWTASAYFKDSS